MPYSWSRRPSGEEVWDPSWAGEQIENHSECNRCAAGHWNEAACSAHSCEMVKKFNHEIPFLAALAF